MRSKSFPTGAALGAEVRGVDLALPVPDDLARALREAWYEHLVLLFRGQDMSDDAIMRTATIFGGAQASGAHSYFKRNAGTYNPQRVDGYPEIFAVTNLDENGRPTLDNGGLGSHEVVWHSDNSYVEVPPAGSFLYAIEVPIGGGGDTSFNNQYLAYETLPAELSEAIEGRSQVHDSSRNSAGVLRPGVTAPETPADVQGPTHPLVRVHPHTGRARALPRTAAHLAVELHHRPARRRERSAARCAVGARDEAGFRVGALMARRRRGAVGQPVLDALSHADRSDPATGDASGPDRGGAGGRPLDSLRHRHLYNRTLSPRPGDHDADTNIDRCAGCDAFCRSACRRER